METVQIQKGQRRHRVGRVALVELEEGPRTACGLPIPEPMTQTQARARAKSEHEQRLVTCRRPGCAG